MKKVTAQTLQAFILIVTIVAYCRPAHAYVDMGTGSYMVQVGIAAVAGAMFSARACWSQLLLRMNGHGERTAKTPPTPQSKRAE